MTGNNFEDHEKLENEEAAMEALGKAIFVTNRFLINRNKSRMAEFYQKLKRSKEEA